MVIVVSVYCVRFLVCDLLVLTVCLVVFVLVCSLVLVCLFVVLFSLWCFGLLI